MHEEWKREFQIMKKIYDFPENCIPSGGFLLRKSYDIFVILVYFLYFYTVSGSEDSYEKE